MTRRPRALAALSAVVLLTAAALPAESPRYSPLLELPAADLPANLQDGYFLPAAGQALALTGDLFELSHWGLAALSDWLVPRQRTVLNQGLRYLLSAPWVWFGTELPVPLGTWNHEQYHVAALRQAGVSSRNGNSFLRWDGTVYDVSDAELIAAKAEDPAALVRAHAAGLEANNSLVLAETSRDFFLRGWVSKPFLYLYSAYYNWNYLRLAAGPQADDVKQAILDHESAVPEERDFTGLDPLGWVYDLFRPPEPYAARGPHPSGVGIARPLGWSDLTAEEQRFLKLQYYLSLINFLNPLAFFLHHVQVGDWQLNLVAQHTLTSFGYSVDVHALLKRGEMNLRVSQANQWNHERWYPGLALQLVEYPAASWLRVSPRLAVWLQPPAQEFKTDESRLGGLAAAELRAPLGGPFGAFAELGYKSEGWVLGEMSLEATWFGRAGLHARF